MPGPRSDIRPPRRGRPSLDLAALRRVLGGSAIVEALELKAAGRPTVNAAQMWRYFTTSVYTSGDLPVIATREALQNSADAIRAAVRARKIGAKEGRFDVVWDEAQRTLTWSDNGIGMDSETILTKFLSLGDTGKADASSSQDAAGGFGVAKAVILGLSATFRWELYTRDNHAVSAGANEDVSVYAAPPRPGTQIVVYDVPPAYDSRYNYARNLEELLQERLLHVLAANDLPEIALYLNGQEVSPTFSRRGGSRIAHSLNWGEGTSALVRAYRRPPGKRGGAFYIRLGGLFQYSRSSSASLPADIIVDLTTTIRPGSSGYPLNAARDQLQGQASWALQDIVREVERENESVGDESDYEVYLPDSDAGIAETTRAALEDPELQEAVQKAASGLSDYYRAAARQPRTVAAPTSKAPLGSRATDDEPPPDGGESVTLAELAGPKPDLSSAVQTVRKLLASSGMSEATAAALDRAAKGQTSALDAAVVGQAAEQAAEQAVEQAARPGGSGLIAAVAAQRALAPLQRLLPSAPARSPFGKLAGLRISKKNYDRARASRFRRDFGKWLPYLIVWDATLRLIAGEGRIRRRFSPGFVLDDRVTGLASLEQVPGAERRAVVYVHPDTLKSVVTAHKSRPMSIAYWLHGLGCHELTHLDGRMGEGHSESFISNREELGFATSHLLPPLAALVERVLQLGGTAAQTKANRPRATQGRGAARQLAADGIARLGEALMRSPPPGTAADHVADFMRRMSDSLSDTLEALILEQWSR